MSFLILINEMNVNLFQISFLNYLFGPSTICLLHVYMMWYTLYLFIEHISHVFFLKNYLIIAKTKIFLFSEFSHMIRMQALDGMSDEELESIPDIPPIPGKE